MNIEIPDELAPGRPTCRRGEGFADNIEIGDGRIAGRAVPYGVTIELMPGLFERFNEGTFSRQVKDPSRVKICLEHGEVVGKADMLEERADGLWFAGSVSASTDIPEARRARALLDEDLIDELSIGFQGVKDGTKSETREDGSTLWDHVRARLLEISLVPWGAYGRGATLSRSRLVDPSEDILEMKREAARQWVESFRSRA